MATIETQRTEKKYIHSIISSKSHLNKLKNVLQEDTHNGNDGYLVRSLYFDSIFDDDFYDKEDGLENRRKIRLRIYPPDFTLIKLELKEKNGSSQRKRSISISREDAEALVEREFSILLRYDDELALMLYRIMTFEQYIPRCIVEYRRTAFLLPVNDIRITFDAELQANESSFDKFFNKDLDFHPIIHEDNVILEVKYNNFLFSYIRDLLCYNGKIETSVSKYYLARGIGHF